MSKVCALTYTGTHLTWVWRALGEQITRRPSSGVAASENSLEESSVCAIPGPHSINRNNTLDGFPLVSLGTACFKEKEMCTLSCRLCAELLPHVISCHTPFTDDTEAQQFAVPRSPSWHMEVEDSNPGQPAARV